MPLETPSKVKLLHRALIKVLRPMVKLLLSNGVAYDDFAKITRSIYVEVAHNVMIKPGRKQTLSNVAVVTGIHRHEVKRLLEDPPHQEEHSLQHNRAARVINGWCTDTEFSTPLGPRELNLDTDFKALIQRYSGDITARAIIDELLRIGVAERTNKGSLKLLVPAYVPLIGDEDLVQIFGDSVADLITTFEYNMSIAPEKRRLQMSAIQDNLPDEIMCDIEAMITARSMTFLTDLNKVLQTQDRDSNPSIEGTGRNRAGVGLYFFKEKLNDE